MESVVPGLTSFAKRQAHIEDSSDSERDSDSETGSVNGDIIGTNGCSTPALERKDFLLPFSAHDLPTLKNNIAHYRNVAEGYKISDLAYTLGCRRSAFFNCAYAVVRGDELEDDLMEHEITFSKRGKGANIAFIFTGQGAQSAQMGKELMLTFPSYIDTIRKLDKALQSLGADAPSWTLEDVLLEPAASSKINDSQLSQPVCTAVQIAIVELLRLWGITPKACIGHSSGEIASAFASGALTAEEAIISAYYRGVAIGGLTVTGTMLAVGASPEEIEPYLEDGVVIACYNSPNSVTLSGDIEAAKLVKEKLDEDKVFVRELKTGGRAYHSHHMQNIGAEYEERLDNALANLSKAHDAEKNGVNSRAIMFSSVSGERKLPSFHPTAAYWRSNLESPVRFSEAVQAAIQTPELEINQFIEIGPHSALAGPLRQIRDGLGMNQKELDYAPTLVRGQSSVIRLLDLAGVLTTKAYPVNLARVNAIEKRVGNKIVAEVGVPIVDLPLYSWNYEGKNALYRNVNRPDVEYRTRKFPHHDLLGSQIPGSSVAQRQWRNQLDMKNSPWLEEHKLGSQPVLPGTGYIAIAAEAARQFLQGKVSSSKPCKYHFPRVDVLAALNVPPSGSEVEIMTTMRFATISASIVSKTVATFTISSCQNGIWTENCVGTVRKEDVSEMTPLFDDSDLQEPKPARTWYKGFSKISLNYGPPFQGLDDIRTDPAVPQAFAHTALLPTDISAEDSTYLVHPAAMDTCIQVALIAAHRSSLTNLKRSFVPTKMEGVSLWAWNGEKFPKLTAGNGKVLASGKFHSLRILRAKFQLSSPDGKPLFELENLECTQYAEKLDDLDTENRHPYLRVVWKPDIDKMITKLPQSSLLDLIAHKRPTMDILEITGAESEYSQPAHKTLESGSTLRRYNSYTVMAKSNEIVQSIEDTHGSMPGVSVQNIDVLNEDGSGREFDLMIISSVSEADAESIIDKTKPLLKSSGHVMLSAKFGASEALLKSKGLRAVQKDNDFMLFSIAGANSPKVAKDIVLVTRTAPSAFDSKVLEGLKTPNRGVTTIPLDSQDINIDADAIYIFIVESETSIFEGALTEQELKTLQTIASSVKNILWITHGNLLVGQNPAAAIVIGLGRTLQTEYPALTFRTLDLDHKSPRVASSQILVIVDSLDDSNPSDDKEYIVKDSTFYVSRLGQDVALDEQFTASADTEPMTAEYDPKVPVRLRIERVGLLDTLYFEEFPAESAIPEGKVEVELKSLGINMKDYVTLLGKSSSRMRRFF